MERPTKEAIEITIAKLRHREFDYLYQLCGYMKDRLDSRDLRDRQSAIDFFKAIETLTR